MKKGFSLIETVVAISIIFVGFAALVSIALSAVSTSNSSKVKVKATAYASGILEQYRNVRDEYGILSLTSYPTPTNAIIDGVRFVSRVYTYNIDQNSVLVEANVSWSSKVGPTPYVRNFIVLTNYYDQSVTVPAPYVTPVWFVTPFLTFTPAPTSTPVVTLTPTPPGAKFTLTPTPMCSNGGIVYCSSYGCKCVHYSCIYHTCTQIDGDLPSDCIFGSVCGYY